MASDNFDAGFALAEDEVQLLRRLKDLIEKVTIPAGQTHFEAVKVELQKYAGTRWSDVDIINFYNYSKTVSPQTLAWSSIYQRFICDLSTFQVPSRFYNSLAQMPSGHQSLRLAVLVRMQTSDEATECLVQRSIKVANAVKGSHFDAWKEQLY